MVGLPSCRKKLIIHLPGLLVLLHLHHKTTKLFHLMKQDDDDDDEVDVALSKVAKRKYSKRLAC